MTKASAPIDVIFLDVGQGTSMVILFRDSDDQTGAIVVDCGHSGIVTMRLLQRFADYVHTLILTHNHRDHAGGAERVIRYYTKRAALRHLTFLRDSCSPAFERILKVLDDINASYGGAHMPKVSRLEQSDGVLIDEGSLSIQVLAPTFMENVRTKDPNATSGVLRASCYGNHVLFGGDAVQGQWERISRDFGVIQCEAVVVPHHGGQLSDDRAASSKWFFEKAIKAKFAIFSVGSGNTYGHPAREMVNACVNSGTAVVCTQITAACCADSQPVLLSLAPGVVTPSIYSQSSARNKKGHTIGCASSTLVSFDEKGPTWGGRIHYDGCIYGSPGLNHVQEAIDDKIVSGRACLPMCRLP